MDSLFGFRGAPRALLFIAATVQTLWFSSATILGAGANRIAPGALAEIQALEAEKAARSPVEQKIDSNLIYARKELLTGKASPAAPRLRPDVKVRAGGRVLVDITATVSDDLLGFIGNSGGEVVNSFVQYKAIQAAVPIRAIESIAGRADVRFVARAHERRHNLSSVDAEGDICHEANLARATFGADGTGVKVGVISDDDLSNAVAVASGDLPSNVTTLPGQAGVPHESEGTAMLELIYRLAPGAQLYFATDGPSPAQGASNILALARAGCKIIVDDVTYTSESPFQEGQPVAEAVQTVSDQGVLYFSSAANNGNQDSGKSGTWEGDFADGGAVGPPISGKGKPGGGVESGRLHDFGGGTNYNVVAANPKQLGVVLWWSDPLGASTNDYDLFVLDATGSSVVGVSNSSQTGTQDPAELVLTNVDAGNRIVIVKYSGDSRFLHLAGGQSFQLSFSTSGNILGHNCSSAANAFCVAATPAAAADSPGDPSGPYPIPFTGGLDNLVEFFSSDGPRRLFYYPDGTPITPGNFSSTGGRVLAKPDFTAADGVSTSLPFGGGLNPFFGTSCAAPHAAAIAALLVSYNPSLTPSEVRSALTVTALPLALDSARTAGAGIVMAYPALASVSANSWTNPTGGKWEVAPNWSAGKAPDHTHTIVISNTPTKTVTIDATTTGSFPTNLFMLNLTVSAPSGSTNTLLLNNAGTARPLWIIPGAGPSPPSGNLILDGNGTLAVNHSAFSVLGGLYVGNAGGNNLMVLTNGGTLTNALGHVGLNSSSSNNTVLVSGPGSVWNNTNNLELGESGAGNAMTISSGGVVFDRIGNLGFNGTSSNNSAWVTGSGSLWSNRVEVNVGVSSAGNSLVISNGGAVVAGFAVLGFNSSSSNNSALVTGGGSLWSNQLDLFVGQNGGGNQLTVSSNGLVLARDVFVGSAPSSLANQVTIAGGGLYATNPLGNSVLDIRNGAFILNSGAVTADQLLLTNGANSMCAFIGGLLACGSASVNNGQTFIVGDGSSPARLNLLGGALPDLLGGIYSFGNGVQIRSNAFLTGCGTIGGGVTIDRGGTVEADCGDTLNFFGAVTINGTVNALNGTFINFYGPVANNGVIDGTGGNVRFFATVENAGTLVTNNMAALPTLTTLHSFTGGVDGASPYAGLVQGSDGHFYGTTVNGGSNSLGTVFRISSAGAFTNLHSFAGGSSDGANPYGGLVQGSDGYFYGTTYNGGANGLGTAFKISSAGTLAWVASFGGPNGANPYAGLIQASDGYFYGTTYYGGQIGIGDPGKGVVFRISAAGALFNLHSIGISDGLYPVAGLVQGSDGNLYGSTYWGGVGSNCFNQCGAIFKMTPGGSLTPLVIDAGNPLGGFVQGSDGFLYGTASGLTVGGDGSVFRLNVAGGLTIVHSFTNFVGEGARSAAGLVEGSDGNFYGTTVKGGLANTGTVFRITSAGALTTLYSFGGGVDGAGPSAGLVQGIDGDFYGTTYTGGTFGWGTVFKLSVFLIPPANQLAQITGIQIAGTNVVIALTSVAAKAYQLQYRNSLGAGGWSNVVGTATISLGGPLTLIDPGGMSQAQRFYRIVITP